MKKCPACHSRRYRTKAGRGECDKCGYINDPKAEGARLHNWTIK